MKKFLKRLGLALLLACAPLAALAQVKQSGNVVPTHGVAWTTTGIVQDAGDQTSPFIATFGILNGTGTGFCIQSDKTTAAARQQFCLGTTTAGGAVLSTQNFGTAPAQGITFNLNGTAAGLALVSGATVSGDGACFSNTTGTIIDCGFTPIGPNTQIDVFLVIGDSNAVGQGSSASSPVVPATQALMYCANGTVVAANDPTCNAVTAAQNANTGSMWPALALSYGRKIGFVLTGVGGSTQASACDFGLGNGNWQATTAGSNYANALAAINAALPAYTAAGLAPVFRGVIYVLGSNDAAQIDSSVCTAGQYTTALTAMVANWRGATINGATYPRLEFYMPIIGTNSAFSDSGYSQVRAAQLAFAASDQNTTVPFTDMFSFSWRSLMQVGTAHPTQAGYNIMGTAIGAALIPGIPANIPYQLFSANAGIGGVPPTGTVLQVVGVDLTSALASLDSYASPADYIARRADGTLQAPSAVQSGEAVGVFSAQSYGATTFGTTNQGALVFSASQNHTDTAKGTQACIFTTANGSASPTCNLTVGQNGLISAGALTLSSTLTTNVTGSTQCLHANSSGVVSGTGADCSAVGITVGTTTISSGTTNQIVYDNGGVVGEITKCNTGAYITNGSGVPSCAAVPNANLVNSSVTYGSTAVALGATSTSIAGLTELSLTSASGATVDWNSDTYIGRNSAATIRLGQADAASAVAQTLGVQGVAAGTSNIAGANFTIAGSKGTGTGIGGSILVQVAPAGSTGSSQNSLVTKITVLGSGNIGFGTETNPQFPFVVSQNTSTGNNILTGNNGIMLYGVDGTAAGFNALTAGAAATNLFTRVDTSLTTPSNLGNAENVGALLFSGWGNGALQSSRARLLAVTSEAWSGTTFGTFFQFDTTPAGSTRGQAMRVMGGVIVGTTTTDPGAGNFWVDGATITFNGLATDATHTDRSVCQDTTSKNLLFGSGAAGICLGTSSARFKHDIHSLAAGLDQIAKLQAVSYRLNADHGDPNKILYGFTAEQGIGVLPDLVQRDAQGRPQTFDYMGVVPVLVRAVQQLKAENDNMQAEINTLRRKLR